MRDALGVILSKGCDVSSPYKLNSSPTADTPQKALITLCSPVSTFKVNDNVATAIALKNCVGYYTAERPSILYHSGSLNEHHSSGLQHLTYLQSNLFASFLLLFQSKLLYNFIF